jgi:hypothetical protein
MRSRSILGTLAVLGALVLPACALADSTGTVAGLRSQVTRFITAELQNDDATVCAIVGTPRNGTLHGKSCDARWHASIKHFLAQPGGRHELRSDMKAVSSGSVSSNGTYASITLPHPLLGGQSDFSWYDNCWMLES